MKNGQKTIFIPVHETFRIAAVLAVVGGFLDAYTYRLRGGVFANAQTGNLVLLGINLAEGRFRQAMYYVAPIVAFALGVFITEMLKKYVSRREFMMFEHWIIAMELALLFAIGFLPLSVPNGVVNVAISFVCSLQVNSFRKVKNLPYATTMCTGNLRSGTEKLFHSLVNKEKGAGRDAAHYFGIIILFVLGAFLGDRLTVIFTTQSIWFCCAALMFVYAAMGRERRRQEMEK